MTRPTNDAAVSIRCECGVETAVAAESTKVTCECGATYVATVTRLGLRPEEG